MKTLSLTALALLSTSAMATDARVAAHQGNAGIRDSTDYRTYVSRTDDGDDSIFFDLDSSDGVMSGAYKANGTSVALSQNATGDATSIQYYSADGDTGYGVGLEVIDMENFSVGGGYGTTSGDTDLVYGGQIIKTGDDIGILVGVFSRELTKKDVTTWNATLSHGEAGQVINGSYGMGVRHNGDRSKAAMTLGPSVGVNLPSEGDMTIDLSLVSANIAGEFALNDWFGLRGSVVSDLMVVDPTGELDLASSGVSPMFGASIDFEGADIDMVIDPSSVLNGPYFLTGAASAPAMMMSARFDI